jgi:putative transposase
VQDKTEDDRPFRMLTVIDEFTRRCLAIVVARRLRSDDVLYCLTDLMSRHGPPEHIRSDNVLRWEHGSWERQQISFH